MRHQKFAKFFSYFFIIFFIALLSVVTRYIFAGETHVIEGYEMQFLVLGSLFFIGYCINRMAPRTAIPSFVWAIFAGMAAQPLISIYTHDLTVMKVIMEVFAAFVLFAGGLDIPFKNFRKWFFPIASLSFIGVVISAVLFAAVLFMVALFFGLDTSALLPSIIILSAALASTDPTAIIPTLKNLHFKRPHLRQIAIAESALTDVSGSILTRFLMVAMLAAPITATAGLFSYFTPLFKKPVYDALALQILTGIIVGYIGYYIIKKLYSSSEDKQGDPALLLSVPIFTFLMGNVLGGAGFLASFVAGLFSEHNKELKQVAHFYNSLLDHLIKPFIFIVLGALVPLSLLIELAPVGIIAAILFMFVVRPLVVGISLLPWVIQGQFTFRDLIFLSFIRETGIIAAILIIIAATTSIISSQFVIAIGMWIILLTLIIEPPLTPMLAKAIGVADEK